MLLKIEIMKRDKHYATVCYQSAQCLEKKKTNTLFSCLKTTKVVDKEKLDGIIYFHCERDSDELIRKWQFAVGCQGQGSEMR